MKTLKQIFEALLGLSIALLTSFVTIGRWAWRKFRIWWKRRRNWFKILIVCCILVLFSAYVYNTAWRMYYRHFYYDRDNFEITYKTSVRSCYNGTYRLYDDYAQKYISPRYKWISYSINHEDYDDSLTVFCDRKGKRGFINVHTGEVAIEAQYEAAWVLSDGLAAVMKDDKIGFINRNNEIVIPFKFGHYKRIIDYSQIDYAFHNGYCLMLNEDGYYGIIDKTGEWVVEPIYYHIFKSYNTNGYVLVTENDKQGLVNMKMETIFPPEYDNIEAVEGGYIVTKENRMWKTDFDGNVTVPFMFDYMGDISYLVGYDKDDKFVYKLSEDFKEYYIGDYIGIYNIKNREIVTPAIYTDIEMIAEDLFRVELSNEAYYLIDGKGNMIHNDE